MKQIGNSILLAAALILAGCDIAGIRGNGKIVSEQRSIEDFTEIKGSGGLKIEWHPGSPSLTITTDQNLLQYITTRVEKGTLRLSTRERLNPSHHINIAITNPRLNGADLRGAVDLKASNVPGPKFYVRASGASDITVDGTVDEFLADLTGATDLRAKDLQAKTAEISSTGASSATVSVSEALRVSITGAADVNYYGTPKTIQKHVTGAGSIHHKD